MRLIDADELLKRVDEERKYLIARGQTGAEHILVHNFRDLIDNAPTVETEITKELRQIKETMEIIKKHYILLEKSPTDNPNDYNFCPNCGADMRGEEK